MNNKSTPALSLLSFAVAICFLFPVSSFAQQKSDDQTQGKKTITIHVTKQVDGNKVVIDTTVVTDGDFDADAFLEEKGILNDMPEAGNNVEKHIIIRHPGSQEFSWNESEDNSPDTVGNKNKHIFIFKDDNDLIEHGEPRGGMPFHYKLRTPDDFPGMQNPDFEDMLEGMARSLGLENVMPFGEMKQVVVKKKRNGKKVIITFEDRKNDDAEKEHEEGNRKKEEKVIIYRNGEQGGIPQNEERVIVKNKPGENVVIRKTVKKTENGDQVIINAQVENPTPVKKETRVIIIKEDGTK